jgi:hypothetical protein
MVLILSSDGARDERSWIKDAATGRKDSGGEKFRGGEPFAGPPECLTASAL